MARAQRASPRAGAVQFTFRTLLNLEVEQGLENVFDDLVKPVLTLELVGVLAPGEGKANRLCCSLTPAR